MAEAPTGLLEEVMQQHLSENARRVNEIPLAVRADARIAYANHLRIPQPENALEMAIATEKELPKIFKNLPKGAKVFVASEKVKILPKDRAVEVPVLPDDPEEIVRIVRERSPIEGNTERPGLALLYDESIVETARMLNQYITEREYLLDRHGENHKARRVEKVRYSKDSKLATALQKKQFRHFQERVMEHNGFRNYTMVAAVTGMTTAHYFSAVNPVLAENITNRGLQVYYYTLGDTDNGVTSYHDMDIPGKIAVVRMGVDYIAQSLQDMVGGSVPNRTVNIL